MEAGTRMLELGRLSQSHVFDGIPLQLPLLSETSRREMLHMATLIFHVTSAPLATFAPVKPRRASRRSLVAFTSPRAAQTTYSLLEVSAARARRQAVNFHKATGTNFRGIIYFTAQHH